MHPRASLLLRRVRLAIRHEWEHFSHGLWSHVSVSVLACLLFGLLRNQIS